MTAYKDIEIDNISYDCEKGWTKNVDSEVIEASIDKSIYTKRQKPKKDGHGILLLKDRRLCESKTGTSPTKVTLLGLMCKLDLLAWNDFVRNKERLPMNMKEFLNQIFGTTRKIKIKGEADTLHQYRYDYFEFKKEMPKDVFRFVFQPLNRIVKLPYGYSMQIAHFDKNGEEVIDYVHCDSDILDAAMLSLNGKYKECLGDNYFTMVGGFVRGDKNGFPEFLSMEFMPVIPQGLWTESSYENRVYSKLVANKVSFLRGYEPMACYNNYIPDIIFRTGAEGEKAYIGEMFGIERIDRMDENKLERMRLAEENKDKFDFWCWDVTERAAPPEVQR